MVSPMNINYRVNPGGKLLGEVQVPGDKSISHRAIMLGSIASGETVIEGWLKSEDCLATMRAMQAMGVRIEDNASSAEVKVYGQGLESLQPPSEILDLGNSGTSIRLMMGLLAGQTFDTTLTGDASLCMRPMERVAQPLRLMGADITTTDGKPPVKCRGGKTLHGIEYTLPVPSAQVKSSILLAGLYANGETAVIETKVTRDHTERMLQTLGYPVQIKDNKATLIGKQKLTATALKIPADISSAAFFMVGASIAPGSEVLLTDVGINPTRIGVINILRLMGANIEITNSRFFGKEPVADIKIKHAPLRGIEIPEQEVSLAIDEFPVLFIAAAYAKGTTIVRHAAELRVKESDRILAMVTGLQQLGIQAQALPDGAIIEGGMMQGGTVESHGDHRIAMAFSIAALCAKASILIKDCQNVVTSFPGYVQLAAQLGLDIAEERQ